MMWFDGPWQHHGWFFGGGWAMGIGMIAVIAISVVLIVYLVRLTAPAASSQAGATAGSSMVSAGAGDARQLAGTSSQQETPREIVQRRYASGEIDRDEYLQKLGDL